MVPWSKEEDEQLKRFMDCNVPNRCMAKLLRRPLKAIKSRKRTLECPNPKIWSDAKEEKLLVMAFAGDCPARLQRVFRIPYRCIIEHLRSLIPHVMEQMDCSREEARAYLHMGGEWDSDLLFEQKVQELVFQQTWSIEEMRLMLSVNGLSMVKGWLLKRWLKKQVLWIQETFECSGDEARTFLSI